VILPGVFAGGVCGECLPGVFAGFFALSLFNPFNPMIG